MMLTKPGRKVVRQRVRLEKDRFSRVVQNLDLLEGLTPDFLQEVGFRRVKMQVSTSSKGRIVTWTDVGNEANVQALPGRQCGHWAKHVAGRSEKFVVRREEINAVLDNTHLPPDFARQATVDTASIACHPARKQYHMVLLNLLKIGSASLLLGLASS